MVANKAGVTSNPIIIDVAVNNNVIVIVLSNYYLLRWNLSIDYSMANKNNSTSGSVNKMEYDYIDLSPIIKGQISAIVLCVYVLL